MTTAYGYLVTLLLDGTDVRVRAHEDVLELGLLLVDLLDRLPTAPRLGLAFRGWS